MTQETVNEVLLFGKLIETSFFRLNETFYDIDTRYPAKYLQEYSHIV